MATRQPLIVTLNRHHAPAGGIDTDTLALTTTSGRDADLILNAGQARWLMRELATRHAGYALAIADQLRDPHDPRSLHEAAAEQVPTDINSLTDMLARTPVDQHEAVWHRLIRQAGAADEAGMPLSELFNTAQEAATERTSQR